MQDRSSRPYSSPHKTDVKTTQRCIMLRLRLREGPVQLAYRLGIAASMVHRILRSAHLNRLSYTDRATGEPIRRYEHDHPGSMLHVDVKKLGNIPDGGGWRYVGRRQGEKHRAATPGKPRSKHSNPLMGKACVHTVIDDHSRVGYAEVHDDETAVTAASVLIRAVEWFSLLVASSSNGCCRIMAVHTARICGGRPVPDSVSRTDGHDRTAHRPTARWNAFTEPWLTVGPTPAAIPLKLSAANN